MGLILEEMKEALIKGMAQKVKELIQASLDQGIDSEVIMEKGIIPAMGIIGEKWKRDEIFMPEVLIAARAMNAGLEVLDPILGQRGSGLKGKMVIATVRGDLHDIGKNMVSMMFRGAGYKVIDLGVDVHEDRIVDSIRNSSPRIVGLSALLTTTMPSMKTTIEAIENAGLRRNVLVMVGGAPVTQNYASQIGADGYAENAASAVDKAEELLADRQT